MTDASNYTVTAYIATITHGGVGYITGDTVTLSGGTGTAPTYTVTASGGVTMLLTLSASGNLTAFPSNPASFSGGSGNGLKANIYITNTTRTLATRAADNTNLKDFGAVMNGATNDLAAYQAAYNETSSSGTINIPAGGALGEGFTGDATKSVLWKTLGTFDYGTSSPGTNPVTSMGDGDVLETFLGGRKRFSLTQTLNTTAGYAVVEVDYTTAYSSGVSGNVNSGLLVSATQNAAGPSAGVWAINANTFITGTAGDNIGVGASTWIQTSGAGSSIALYSQVYDYYGDAGDTTACEFDIYGVAADPIGTAGPLSGRRAIMVLNSGENGSPSVVPEVSRAIGIGNNGTANIGVGVYATARLYYAAFDCSQATFLTTDSSGNAVKVAAYRMGPNMPIDFSAVVGSSTLNHNTLLYNSTSGNLEYQIAGTAVASFSATGIKSTPIAGSTGSFTTLAATSTVSGAGFTTFLASPPNIGGTASSSASFTTITLNSAAGTLVGINATGSYINVLNTVPATTSGSVIKIGAGQTIALETTNTLTIGQVGNVFQFASGTNIRASVNMSTGTINVQSGGFYQINGVKVMGAPVSGYGSPTGASRLASFPGSSATLAQCSAQIAQMIVDLKTLGPFAT